MTEYGNLLDRLILDGSIYDLQTQFVPTIEPLALDIRCGYHRRMLEPILETDRLTLRWPLSRDFETYESFFTDAQASEFYGGPIRADQAWRQLASDIGHWHLRGYGVWAIETKSDGEMIGICGFSWPIGWPRRELTWWVLPHSRRNGYASEASRAAIRFAYRELGWEIVETHMLDANEPARQLVLRLGGKMIAREKFPDNHTRNVYMIPNPSE